MGRKATVYIAIWFGALIASAIASGEDWVRLGNSAIDFSLAGLATGSVERVWYAPQGDSLFIQTSTGKIFETKDFESWKAVPASTAPPAADQGLLKVPETGAR